MREGGKLFLRTDCYKCRRLDTVCEICVKSSLLTMSRDVIAVVWRRREL